MSKKASIYACKYVGVPASRKIDAHVVRFNFKDGTYVDVQISKTGNAIEVSCAGQMIVLPNVGSQVTVKVKPF